MKKALSIILSGLMTTSTIPFCSVYAEEQTDAKWDRFIKYDLCITDYDSLSDSEKELCHFIYDTEQSAEDTVICERARRTLAGDKNIGERLTLDELQNCYGVWDDFSETKVGRAWYTHCVPDIKHLDSYDDYNEYWLNDSGTVKVCFTGENSGIMWSTFKGEASGLTYDEAKSYDYTQCIKQEDGTYAVTFDIEATPVPEDRFICVDGEYSILPDGTGTILSDGDLYYILPDDSAVLVKSKYAGGNVSADKVVVPDEIDGHTVRVIGSGAFGAADVKEVVLPDTIEAIESRAFINSFALEKINFPKNLSYMGAMAFDNCESLGNIYVDCAELDIPYRAFESCTNLVAAWLKVRSVGDSAFSDCTKLNDLCLMDGIERISADAFGNCTALADLALPQTARFIGQGAFAGTAVKEVSIPVQTELIGVLPRARGVEARSAIEPSPAYKPLDVESVCAFPVDCKILVYKGSEAERYAEEWNLEFSLYDELKGDANLDIKVTVADSVAILQHIANRDKYELKPQGLLNADVDGEAGVTANDARILQERDSNNFI